MIARAVRDFGPVRIDTNDWPIIVMEFPEKRFEEVFLHDSLEHIERILRESEAIRERSFQITDLTRMQELAPAVQRKYAAEWMKRTLPLQRAASVGAANVTPSAILRGLVTAVHWFQPPQTPTFLVATRREAMVEALKVLDAAHVPVSTALRARITKYEGKAG